MGWRYSASAFPRPDISVILLPQSVTKRGVVMKKFIAGAVFGAILASTVTAYGATTLIGKKIQGETDVIVNGTKLDTAIIVDGKSYAPLRSVGSVAGYEVGFTSDKKITLDTPKETTSNETGGEDVSTTVPEDKSTTKEVDIGNGKTITLPIAENLTDIKQIDSYIQTISNDITGNKVALERMTSPDDPIEMVKTAIAKMEQCLEELQARKAELEAQ